MNAAPLAQRSRENVKHVSELTVDSCKDKAAALIGVEKNMDLLSWQWEAVFNGNAQQAADYIDELVGVAEQHKTCILAGITAIATFSGAYEEFHYPGLKGVIRRVFGYAALPADHIKHEVHKILGDLDEAVIGARSSVSGHTISRNFAEQRTPQDLRIQAKSNHLSLAISTKAAARKAEECLDVCNDLITDAADVTRRMEDATIGDVGSTLHFFAEGFSQERAQMNKTVKALQKMAAHHFPGPF